MKEKTIIIVAFILFFSLSIIYGIIVRLESDKALKDNVAVIATVTSLYNAHGPTVVEVKFDFNNEVIKTSFDTYHWDSLAVNTKIRVLVAKRHPEYIKYIGVAK
jgi:hypothetical protein